MRRDRAAREPTLPERRLRQVQEHPAPEPADAVAAAGTDAAARPTRPATHKRQGATVIVRDNEIEAYLQGISASTRALLRGRHGQISLGCFKLVKVERHRYPSGVGASTSFAPVVRARLSSPDGPFTAPFDGCTLAGSYGHSWNDGHGTHTDIEIPLTRRGRRYFAERAVARDLAWLARARIFHHIRYAHAPQTTEEAARRLGKHVVALPSRAATTPIGKLGLWIGPDRRITLAETGSHRSPPLPRHSPRRHLPNEPARAHLGHVAPVPATSASSYPSVRRAGQARATGSAPERPPVISPSQSERTPENASAGMIFRSRFVDPG